MNTLLTPEQFARLKENGIKNGSYNCVTRPVVSLSFPNLVLLGETKKWLISAIEPLYPHIAYGIYDDCTGFPKMKYISLDELETLTHPISGDTVYNDTEFEGKFSLSVYNNAALDHGEIITDDYLVAFYEKEIL